MPTQPLRPYRSLAGLAAIAACGCGSAPPPVPVTALNSIPRVDPEDFPGISGRRIQWDAATDDRPALGAGSKITIGIQMHSPGEPTRRWLVELTFVERISGGFRGVQLNGEQADLEAGLTYVSVKELRAGAEEETWLRRVPISAFAAGFTDAIHVYEEHPAAAVRKSGEELSRELVAQLLAGMVCGMSLTAPFQEDSSLREIALEVCRIPSYLSIALSMGVNIGVQFRFEDAIRMPDQLIEGTPTGLPLYSLPVTVSINRSPSLECRVLVTDPRPPLTLVGGFLGMVGEQPGAPEYRVSAQVLAATPGVEPKPVEAFRAPVKERSDPTPATGQ